jgi:hypothetical protein
LRARRCKGVASGKMSRPAFWKQSTLHRQIQPFVRELGGESPRQCMATTAVSADFSRPSHCRRGSRSAQSEPETSKAGVFPPDLTGLPLKFSSEN